MLAGCASLLAEWVSPEETVCGMDAASEPTGMYSRRVSEGGTHCKAQQALFRQAPPRECRLQRQRCFGHAQGKSTARRRAKGSRTAKAAKQRRKEHRRPRRCYSFFKSVSISCPATSIPESRWISRAQVGLVTLISVRLSPMTSRPTK